jgi:hypothetical protein
VEEARWEGEKIKNTREFLQMCKRERIVCQVKNSKLFEIHSFFFGWQIFLGVSKSQDWSS